ncbi:hypothetical protein DFH11DRAFT_1725972 [Phellopilus nigrolimitatus]|nr:hypothetical protein DFH11DRAFT_1725972 [Phellopilus nigrolimitatus]
MPCRRIADARLMQDRTIHTHFLQLWQATLTNSIAVALKVLQAVSASRLELDTAKEAFETAGRARQEQSRLEVENAEDDLVQKTEVPIMLMKTVLENNLNELIKAQLAYHAPAVEAPSASLSPARGPARLDDRLRQDEGGGRGLRTEQVALAANAASGTNARVHAGDKGGAALRTISEASRGLRTRQYAPLRFAA